MPQDAGMAIITSALWTAATGQTLTGADATALTAWCSYVDAAVKRLVSPFVLEATTYTDKVCDAPTRDVLYLPVYPIRSITSIYFNPNANGEVAAFTSDYLLTANDDYYMPIDDPDGYSRWGKVFRRGFSGWGYEWQTFINRLAPTLTSNRGAIKYTVAAGPASVPDDVVAACVLAVSMLMQRKEGGVPSTSEGWNGGSFSAAASYLATSVLQSPDCQLFLSKYMPVACARA